MLKTYAQLGHVYRTEPCQEYPGEWLVYTNGNNEQSYTTKEEAMRVAYEIVTSTDSAEVSVCWSCTDGDPRVGQVWFTGYYSLGKFDRFGLWRSS